MSKLFSPFKIGELELKNRFVRSATTSYWSDDNGVLTDPILKHYEQLAAGNIGLIIKGHSYVTENGRAHSKQSGLSSEIHIPKMKELTTIVHSYGSKILAQLNHGGYVGKIDRVTASNYKTEKWEARELSKDEIEQIIIDFANAAENAIKAGFDGVEIHAAHGYLVSQFLSDLINKRDDEYGGSLVRRASLLLKIYQQIRKKLGQSAIIGVKINCDDFAEKGGVMIDDTIKILKMLAKMGLSFAEISGGGAEQQNYIRKTRGRANIESGYSEATWGKHVKKIREAIPNLTLIIVDGIRSKEVMETIINKNVADLISMSKPFVNEPDLVNLLNEGQERASCIDCGKCLSKENFAKTMLRCFYKNP